MGTTTVFVGAYSGGHVALDTTFRRSGLLDGNSAEDLVDRGDTLWALRYESGTTEVSAWNVADRFDPLLLGNTVLSFGGVVAADIYETTVLLSDGTGVATATDVSDLANPGPTQQWPRVNLYDAAADGDRAYLVDGTDDTLLTYDVANPSAPVLLGRVALPFGADLLAKGNVLYRLRSRAPWTGGFLLLGMRTSNTSLILMSTELKPPCSNGKFAGPQDRIRLASRPSPPRENASRAVGMGVAQAPTPAVARRRAGSSSSR